MKWVFLLSWVCAAAACGIDTLPLPEDTPVDGTDPDSGDDMEGIDAAESNVLINAAVIHHALSPGGLLVAAGPGALPSGGGQVLLAPDEGSGGVFPIYDDGSFAAEIPATGASVLLVTYVANLREQTSVALQLTQAPLATLGTADASLDVQVIPDGVRVTILAGGYPSGSRVVAANVGQSVTRFAVANVDGGVLIDMPGTSGDTLRIFAVAPDLSLSGGPPTTVIVP